MDSKIYLSKPNFKEILINTSFKDNNVLNFEVALEKYLGSNKKIVALNSGTSAIHLALILAGVQKDDLVICQSFTFVATANPILYQRAKPIFIDSEIEKWSMCPLLLEQTIKKYISLNKKPKAIIVNCNYGMPSKIETIISIAKFYDIKLIEDAASGLGASYKDQKCGTFGDFGIISFNENKILTTFGGGALICKSEEDKNRAIYLASQAKEKFDYYQHSEIGYNYKMDKLSASVGLSELKNIEQYILSRRKIHLFYVELFQNMEGIHVFHNSDDNYFSNHWLTCILINEKLAGFSNEDMSNQLLKDNIESRPLWKPMHLQPVFKGCPFYGDGVSEGLFNSGLCLPSGSNLTENDLERISTSIKKIL
ncbi:DegT/DnrJ/EryC1/StrS family aminotransferase [Polaribacter sp. Hel1_85]|uniref:DegT/DnrJ/EryC1/StrS family aminotransferase n=1 Tax=Polaribacter sp. Hel1_85 TaxID=1250005 RepID=UPI00052BFC26|nr:DegT/DnrJ/EryC1/StrS family aminotransferase [Polaribacter sp. Hel1_85]KGL64346.1 4-keto-6-deoxy-N-Acetyl-D-hexosaminyl-(Lipid carrier) aminotransferase [Polaribacter sp. Hel1_85]